jgi:ABC-type Fe3+ transport system permease subunit
MSLSLQNSFFQELASDTRHFLRRPGLATVTIVAVILILLFIVFPIGSVLVKSFSVTYPTVTVRCRSDVATSPTDSSRTETNRRN